MSLKHTFVGRPPTSANVRARPLQARKSSPIRTGCLECNHTKLTGSALTAGSISASQRSFTSRTGLDRPCKTNKSDTMERKHFFFLMHTVNLMNYSASLSELQVVFCQSCVKHISTKHSAHQPCNYSLLNRTFTLFLTQYSPSCAWKRLLRNRLNIAFQNLKL